MLQIVTGKFFSTDKCFETLHRGVFYLSRGQHKVLAVEVIHGTGPGSIRIDFIGFRNQPLFVFLPHGRDGIVQQVAVA